MPSILITGASTGIGAATAQWFFTRGWNVVATMRQPRGLRSDARWLELPLDVTDPASIDAAFAAAQARFGALDAVVNNAGYGLVGTFESMDEAHIRRQFDTNVFGLMRVCRAAIPQLRASGGVLVNVASMGGRLTFPFYSVYHASKWAVEGFSESLAFELGATGVRVKLIEPGAVKTDFYARSADFVHDRARSEYNAIVDTGMRRMAAAGAKGATADTVAAAIWQAVTDGSTRLRYPVGSDARMLLALRRLIPDGVYRTLVRKQLFG